MRLHTKRGIRLGLAVGIELFLGYVLVAPLGGVALSELCNSGTKHVCVHSVCAANAGELTPMAVQVQEGCMWAAFTRSVLRHTCHQTHTQVCEQLFMHVLQAITKTPCAQDLGKSTMHCVSTKLTLDYVTSSRHSTTNSHTHADFLQHGHHSSCGWQAESAVIRADHWHFGRGCLGLLNMVFGIHLIAHRSFSDVLVDSCRYCCLSIILPSLMLYTLCLCLPHPEFTSAPAPSGLFVHIGHTVLTSDVVQL